MNKKAILIISGLFIATIASVSSSFAWFLSGNKLKSSNNLGGEYISSYFHAGTGAVDDPFEITKPFHYENLVKLHYEHTEFAQQEYYFRFGSTDDKMPGSPSTPVFYGTDSYGAVDTTTTATTLNLGGKSLPPLGTQEYPFIGHIDGSGLTISNFTVAGKGYYDVGIFGYVTTREDSNGASPISNCYWRDFKIDTNQTSTVEHTHTENTHYDYDGSTTCAIGYLAGHTVYAAAFDNCYVNNCTFKGTGSNSKLNTTYGYFGVCEYDYLGGSTGKGHSYSFKLDSEAIYRSTRQVYQTIKDNPIRTRTGYTEYTTPINAGTDPEIYESEGEYYTTHPLSDAISFDGDRTYTLNGSTRSTTAVRNYSFSTIGYQPLTTSTDPIEYEAYYKNSSNVDTAIPENAVVKSEWNGSPKDATTRDNVNTIKESGDFIYHDGSAWKYIHSENTPQTDAREFTIRLSMNSSFEMSGFVFLNSPSLESADIYLYIDGKQIVHQNVLSTTKVKKNGAGTRLTVYNISLSQTDYNVDLTRGVHYFCYFFCSKIDTNQGHYNYLCNSNNSLSITTGGRLSATAGTFTITQSQYNTQRSSRILTDIFTATKSGNSSSSDSGNPIELYSIDSRAPTTADIPPIVSPNSFQTTIYGKNLKTEATSTLNDSSLKFRTDSGKTTEYDPTTGEPREVYWYKWIAYNTPTKAVDTSVNPTFLSDNPDITPKITEKGYTPGYEWKNIDIVGGGVGFYYRNFPLLGFDIRVITLPAETTSNYACGKIAAGDIGKHFYATKYCPSSIVLYFNNSANAADETDHALGDITFEYINASFLGTSWINISVPSFKKGAGEFVDIDEFGTQTGGTLDVRTTYSCEINESGAKACSYCALDKYGDILGVFDAKGNPSTGFIDTSGQLIKSKLMQIETYVIALGTRSNYNISSWITQVDFNYKSNEGYGGTFGSVEYRDRPSTVTTTLLNFFVSVPANANFVIGVTFSADSITVEETTYPANTYFITVYSNVTLTVNVYLYSSDYHFSFNGVLYDSSQIGLTSIPPPS